MRRNLPRWQLKVAALAALGFALGGAWPGPALGQGMMPPDGMGPGMHRGYGRGQGPGPYAQDPLPRTPETVARGKALFQANCAVCHGAQGRGDGPGAKSLNPPPADLRFRAARQPGGALFQVITFGRGNMPAFQGTLSETERWEVIHFLRSLTQ